MNKNVYLITETIIIFLVNSLIAIGLYRNWGTHSWYYAAYAPLLLFQGLWMYRIYIVGHEAAHNKLFPKSKQTNDLWGTIVLIPILVPITIYRKIHLFHHGFNRKDVQTSSLDTYIIKGRFKKAKTAICYILWYLSVFFGGFFLHSLVSVFLFLFVPPKLALKISPAFRGWTYIDQAKSIALFLIGVSIHLLTYFFLGSDIYLFSLGLPMIAFAWVLSLLVYIFHFDTTIGENVRYNVRSVHRVPILSWVLMNFNEHATHHQHPNIPWHQLPAKRKALPEHYSSQNQNTWNFFIAIVNQLKGPNIHYED